MNKWIGGASLLGAWLGWLAGWLAWLVGLPNFLHFSPPSPQDELHDGLNFCIFVSD